MPEKLKKKTFTNFSRTSNNMIRSAQGASCNFSTNRVVKSFKYHAVRGISLMGVFGQVQRYLRCFNLPVEFDSLASLSQELKTRVSAKLYNLDQLHVQFQYTHKLKYLNPFNFPSCTEVLRDTFSSTKRKNSRPPESFECSVRMHQKLFPRHCVPTPLQWRQGQQPSVLLKQGPLISRFHVGSS